MNSRSGIGSSSVESSGCLELHPSRVLLVQWLLAKSPLLYKGGAFVTESPAFLCRVTFSVLPSSLQMGEYGGLEPGNQSSSLQLDYDDASVGFNAANGSVFNNDSTFWPPDGTTVAQEEEKVYWALLLLILPGKNPSTRRYLQIS